jgi:hypothetical protein
MTQNHTLDEGDLSPGQERTVEALVAGSTITAAAEAAGVTRQTIHRWLRESFAFQACLNAARRDLREEVENRLEALATEAIEVVAQAIREGDARVGLAVLRGLGLLDGKHREIGAESSARLESQARNREILDSLPSFS